MEHLGLILYHEGILIAVEQFPGFTLQNLEHIFVNFFHVLQQVVDRGLQERRRFDLNLWLVPIESVAHLFLHQEYQFVRLETLFNVISRFEQCFVVHYAESGGLVLIIHLVRIDLVVFKQELESAVILFFVAESEQAPLCINILHIWIQFHVGQQQNHEFFEVPFGMTATRIGVFLVFNAYLEEWLSANCLSHVSWHWLTWLLRK